MAPAVWAAACPMAEPVLQEPEASSAPAPNPSASAAPPSATGLPAAPIQARWQVPGDAITVGRHFVMQVQLCPADARLLRVDAVMPAHRHGMNYRPSVKPLGQGLWQVDGLLLHMPGEWEWRLDVQAAGRRVTLRDTLNLP